MWLRVCLAGALLVVSVFSDPRNHVSTKPRTTGDTAWENRGPDPNNAVWGGSRTFSSILQREAPDPPTNPWNKGKPSAITKQNGLPPGYRVNAQARSQVQTSKTPRASPASKATPTAPRASAPTPKPVAAPNVWTQKKILETVLTPPKPIPSRKTAPVPNAWAQKKLPNTILTSSKPIPLRETAPVQQKHPRESEKAENDKNFVSVSGIRFPVVPDKKLKAFTAKLFKTDENNAAGKYSFDAWEESKGRYHISDIKINDKDLKKKRTYKALENLMDHYGALRKFTENRVDLHETQETIPTDVVKAEDLFVGAIMDTNIMRNLFDFLSNKLGVTALSEQKAQVNFLKRIWFTRYYRKTIIDNLEHDLPDRSPRPKGHNSNGAQHFLFGESDLYYDENGNEIRVMKGQHSWYPLEMMQENMYGLRETLSHEFNTTSTHSESLRVAELKNWYITYQGYKGKGSSILFGLSPEAEIAFATLCFCLRPNDLCPVRLGDDKTKSFLMKAAPHFIKKGYENWTISSVFPLADPKYYPDNEYSDPEWLQEETKRKEAQQRQNKQPRNERQGG